MVNINYLKRVCAVFLVALSLINFIQIPVHAKTIGEKNSKIKDEKTIVVSMGDSFSSGEGIEPFYDQDKKTAQEKVDSDDWLAHRSEESWPGMLKVSSLEGTLADYKDEGNWYFVASSGAVTSDIMGLKNEFGEVVGQRKKYNIIDGSTMFRYLQPQIDIFNHIDSGEVDYVTLTLGGNDAEFTKIIETAVYNGIPMLEKGNLNTLLKETIDRIDDICGSLADVYIKIAEAAPNASIIVADYPQLLDPRDGSLVWFSKDDAVAINNAVLLFSEKIKETVECCSKEEGISIYFVSVIKEFEGHESYRNCGKDYINGIYTQPKDQDLMTGEPSAYSMHPNKNGAKAYARCVQAKIDELEGISNVTCSSELGISVFGINGKLYDNYKIKIKGKENVALWGLIKKDYNKTIRVNSASVQQITLPEGEYEVIVTDGDISYSKNVKIKKEALQNTLRFETDFGYQYGYEEDNIYIPTTSDERDIVLVLDNSGSMSGTPIEETRKASENFVKTVLQQDASIGIVAFESEANMLSNFSMDEAQLMSALGNLYASGGTNTLAGLTMAGEMLEQSNAKKKIIVLMSDGCPSNSQGELAECAKELRKKGIIIYTLGFFDQVGDDNKAAAQSIMETIADDGRHYEVEDVDNLVFFFGDIADQISGQQYIYIRIACPVEVTVEYDGETLCSNANALNTRTNFGTLTFEERTDGERVKILRLKQGTEYDIRIEGTGEGRMNYTIGLMDENGEYSDMRKFYNVKVTDKTVINTVASESRNTVLEVDEDGDGKLDIQYKAGENSRGEIVKTNHAVWIIPAVILILIAAITLVVLKKKNILVKKG